MRFVYCYQMKEDPGWVQDVAPQHAAYWRELGLPGYAGGPFEDRSGGLILFDAPAEKQASELISDDPRGARRAVSPAPSASDCPPGCGRRGPPAGYPPRTSSFR